MRWRDAATLAARSAGRRPARVALTVLAVALATTLLTALVTIARTAEVRVLDQLAKGGPVSGITVLPAEPNPDQADQDEARGGRPRDLDAQAVARIRSIPAVSDVLPVVSTPVFVVEPSQRPDGRHIEPFRERAVGVDLSRPSLVPVTPIAGRLPQAGSLVDVAVTEAFLKRLGLTRQDAGSVLGTRLELAAGRMVDLGGGRRIQGRWVHLDVVGVVAQGAGSGQLVMPIEQAEALRSWTVSGVDRGLDLGAATSPYSGLFVVARGLDNVGPARDAIVAIGYASNAPENLIASVDNYLGVVEIVLAAVGIIALVVAALGIANALLATVRERRREIGVLKAIGARDSDVLRLFVLEASVLGLIGGAIGTAGGNVAARLVGVVVNRYLADQGLPGVRLTFPVAVLVGGLVGPTVLAVVGGVIPAWQASRLPARDAMGDA